MKPLKSHNAGTLIGFLSCMGLALGLAFGVVKSAHLGLFPAILSFLAVLAFQWFIFKAGKGSSWSKAEAWAQANVDIALEVSNIARAEAQSLSNAYATAISLSNATAQNQTVIQLAGGSVLPLLSQEDTSSNKEIAQEVFLGQMSDYSDILSKVQVKIGAQDEARHEDSPTVAVGELNAQESSPVWASPDC